MSEALPERTDETRANFTRKYLKSQNISAKQLSKMGEKIGITLEEKDYADDKKLTDWVKDVQKMRGFSENEHDLKGQDGMLGRNTMREIAKITTKNTGKEARDNLARDIKKPEAKPEPEAPANPPETKPAPVEAVAEHKGYHGQPETPISTLDGILNQYKERGGTTWAGPLSGNGNRPVAIYVPKGFDPSKPVEIVYHFHGMHGQIIDIKRPKLEGTNDDYKRTREGTISDAHNRIDQALGRIEKQAPTRNAILVYPLSAGQRATDHSSPAWKNGYDGEWMKTGNDTGDDMERLHQETIAQLSSMKIKINKPSVTLSGHSAGGQVLRNITEGHFRADTIKFLDASYGSQAPDTYRAAMKKNPNTKFEVYVHSGSKHTDSADTQRIEHANNVLYHRSQIKHEVFNENFI